MSTALSISNEYFTEITPEDVWRAETAAKGLVQPFRPSDVARVLGWDIPKTTKVLIKLAIDYPWLLRAGSLAECEGVLNEVIFPPLPNNAIVQIVCKHCGELHTIERDETYVSFRYTAC